MVTAIKEEVWEITRDVITTETDITVASGEGRLLQTIWEYLVPTGVSLVFKPEDRFAAFLQKAGPTEVRADALMDIVVSDSSRQSVRPLLNQIRYDKARGSASTYLAFQDADYYNHLDISPGEQVIVKEGERVQIRGNAINETVDASICYFSLTCSRIRHTLFD